MIEIQNWIDDKNLSTVWNEQIEKTDCEYICVLNTDTLVEKDWLSRMLKVFEKEKTVGVVGPVTNMAGSPQKNFPRSNHYQIADMVLSGFCMVFPKSIWKKVGKFDERFRLYGEDSDFINKVSKLGYRTVCQQSSYVFHYGGKSSEKANKQGKDIGRIKQESRQLCRELQSARYRKR